MQKSEARSRVDQEAKNLLALSDALELDTSVYCLSKDEHTPLDPQLFAVKALREGMFKKYEHDTNQEADTAALHKFLQVNEACRNWSLEVGEDSDAVLLGELKSTLYKFCYVTNVDPLISSFEQILLHGKTGPGSSLGASGQTFYEKMFAGPLTYTSSYLYKSYKAFCNNREVTRLAEVNRERAYRQCDRIVKGNRISFVPKNVDISRVIAVEPSLNMYYQLGIKELLERRISSYYGVDIRRPPNGDAPQQEKNRDLARLGSMFEGSYVTVDLSSASDSLSLGMVRTVFPSDFVAWLELVRSPHMTLPDGSELELSMISTMGNGSTFPLQTALFLGVVYSAYRLAGIPLVRPRGQALGNYGVYGDDIIVQAKAYPYVSRLLRILGFAENQSKTFVKGPFRESCGGDYFHGHLVRPFFLNRLLTTQDVYVAVNALNRWSAQQGIPLPRTIRLLLSWVKGFNPVPLAENDDSGIKLPRRALGRMIRDKDTQSVLYERWVPCPPSIRLTASASLTKTVRKKRGRKFKTEVLYLLYNPEGLLQCALSGHISHNRMMLRHKRVRYELKEGIIPYWDYIPEGALLDGASYSMPLGKAICINTGL